MSISLLFISFVVFSLADLPSCFSIDQQYEKCLSALSCGSGSTVFPNITYPFWGTNINKPKYCGQSPFKLSCKNNQTLAVEIGNLTLRVLSTKLENQIITVASWLNGSCPNIWNFSGNDHYTLNPSTKKIDLFDCSDRHPSSSLSNISCNISNNSQKTYHVFRPSSSPPQGCTKVGNIPMLESAKNALHQSNDSNQALKTALDQGFDLRYNIKNQICQACTISNGICGSESRSESFRCLCKDKPHNSSCNDDQG